MAANLPSIQGTPVPAVPRRLEKWRLPLIALAVVAVFIATYVLAWWDAQRLTTTYTADANANFEAGNYLEALTGYEEFDEESNEFVHRGGYGDVARIWQGRYAQPVPASVAVAEARIDEIISERLTVEQAEQFVLRNIGRTNPYLGIVFLRLGELYEAEGDMISAEDIYREVLASFRNQPELIERANANLARIGADE
jgi:tetratricopeptide (TPR) repeat protein